jgi:hypothetical protein
LDDLSQTILLEDPIEEKDRETKGGNEQSIPDYAFQAHRLSISEMRTPAHRVFRKPIPPFGKHDA